MALSRMFLDELKHRNNIVDVISSYVSLKRRGKYMVGLCPFHNEKSGSLTLYPENESFYCFGCGAGGDVIAFVSRIENLDYMETIRWLAQRSGLTVPEGVVDDTSAKLKLRVLEINREAGRFFYKALSTPEGNSGLRYLKKRGLEGETIRHFGLGFSPESGHALLGHLKEKGFKPQEMMLADVVRKNPQGRYYDRFRGRVMFPIIDLRGNVIAFGGRALGDEKPKYLNTGDTLAYHKGEALFALNFAKDSKKRQLILAEGYMDVIALHRAGFTNAIASLGTALTEEQARLIRRYAEEIIICYDSDEAGQKATSRAIPLLKKVGLDVRVITVPGNKDPDEFIRSYGEDGPLRFQALLEQSGNDVEYKLNRVKQSHNTLTDDGKVKYLQEAVQVLAGISNPIERDVYAGRLAEEMDVTKDAVLLSASKLVKTKNYKDRQQEQRKQQVLVSAGTTVNTEKQHNLRAALAEEGIIAYLFQNPDSRDWLLEALPPDKFVTSWGRRVYDLLLGKTKIGAVTLTDFSQDLTRDELSDLTRILISRQEAAPSRTDVREYVGILAQESGFTSPQKIMAASGDDLMEYLEKLKDKKMGEMKHDRTTG